MALDVKISFSWTNYCRLCLLDNGIMLSIFEGEGQSRQLKHKIETCFQLVTYDGDPLPKRICHKCLYKVNETYEFRTMAVSSYERLKTHLLPLKHVPEVQQYLEKADQLQRSMKPNAEPAYQFSSPPASSRGNLAKIRIKSESELMENPSCSSWTSLSVADSAPDSPFSTTSCDSTPVLSLSKEPSLDADNLQHDSLKRKWVSVNVECSSHEAPFLKKARGKKQLAGPASRKRSNPNFAWKCEFCSSRFSSKHSLSIHIGKCLKCRTCHKEFNSVAEKAVHEADEHILVIVDSEKKHLKKRCSLCPARFASGTMLSMHKCDHVQSIKPALSQSQTIGSAEDCTSSFTLPAVHKEVKTTGRISNGEIQFNGVGRSESSHQSDRNLMSNANCEPSGKGSTHICAACEEGFLSVPMLLKHEKIIHGIFRCLDCNESFGSQNALNSHKRSHALKLSSTKKTSEKDASSVTPGKKTTLACHSCYEEFDEEDSFILHLYMHATEESDNEEAPYKKPKKSQMGPKRRKGKPESSATIKSISLAGSDGPNNPTEQFSIKCERCHVVCRSKEYYRVHLATHMSKAKTSFPCSGCNQDFRNVEALNRHTCSGKQSGDMQSCCLDCGQGLVKSEDHVCDNKCPECEKVFKSSRGQRLHYVSKHRNRIPVEDGFFNDTELLGLIDNPTELDEDIEEPVLDQKSQEKKECSAEGPSENEYSSACDSEVSSFIGESPPRERLPPDGAPLEPSSCQCTPSPKLEPVQFDSIFKDTASMSESNNYEVDHNATLVSEKTVPLISTQNDLVLGANSMASEM